MAAAAATQRRAPAKATGQWFEKPGGSPVDRIPAFREAMADVARAWSERFASLAATEGEIKVEAVGVCRVDEILARRSGAAVLGRLHAQGWNTTIGVGFDRLFVTTMVEALFGGGGEDLASSNAAPFSPIDLQIAEVVTRHVAEALTAGFAKRLPSAFQPGGLQWMKLDPGFLGKPNTAVVIGTLALVAFGAAVRLDVLVPLPAMMVFAEELAGGASSEPAYEDPRWTQRLETEVSRTAMRLTAMVDLDPLTLGVIAGLREGQLIELPRGARQRVRLLCGTDDLFRCDLGQSDGHYTLRVEDVLGAVDGELASEPGQDADR